MSIDVETLLADVSPDAPCGENLEYDPVFVEMIQAAQGTEERQVGDSIIPAEEPNWRAVADRCRDLASRTQDLRVATYLILALLKTEGPTGLRDGLAYLHALLERRWDSVHPQLDPEDDNDPTMRVNTIAALAAPGETFGDPMKFVRRVREMTLCQSKQVGSFSMRDIQIANGEVAFEGAEGEQRPEPALIDAAFEDCPVEDLQSTAAAVAESAELGQKIDQVLTEKVGATHAVDLSPFRDVLVQVHQVLEGQLSKRGYTTQTSLVGQEPGAEQAGEAGQRISGEIASPQDVLLALDKVCQYYERHEPSSPVPLLIRRAQRLVSKSFVDIVRDLSPEAMQRIELIGGMDAGQEG